VPGGVYLTIKRRTARELGVALPPSPLTLADRIVD
jgi:hypothetical protein